MRCSRWRHPTGDGADQRTGPAKATISRQSIAYDYDAAPLWIRAVFAVVVVAVARWRGLRALLGIVVAFLVLVVFLLPALRDGAAAIPVALVASAAILYAVIYLAHGVSLRTSAALWEH